MGGHMTPLPRVGSDPYDLPVSSLEDTSSTQSFDDTPEVSPRMSLPMDEEGDGYEVPPIRYPPVSLLHDTAYFKADLTPVSVHGSEELFVQGQFVIKKHAMRYLDCGSYPAAMKVVAVTRDGKHVVWQQGIRACAPAAISMIALDCGKLFLSQEITYSVTNKESMDRYIRKAGFEPVVHRLRGLGVVEKVRALETILARTGPGILHLSHPNLNSHVVVLDEISLEKWRITLREPYHGCMLTMSLWPFIDWIGEEFIAFAEPQKDNILKELSCNCLNG
jgi:hypothetical protein